MRLPLKPSIFLSFAFSLVILAITPMVPAQTFSGITQYYIRLDRHFSSHRSTKTIVTMVPADNDYRGASFSLVLVDGVLKTSSQSSEPRIDAMARKEIFSRILESRGLKSVQTRDKDTIVSYEGLIISPADIVISIYDPETGGYPYTAGVRFSPIAFPDQWDSLQRRYHAKKILNDFFLLFK